MCHTDLSLGPRLMLVKARSINHKSILICDVTVDMDMACVTETWLNKGAGGDVNLFLICPSSFDVQNLPWGREEVLLWSVGKPSSSQENQFSTWQA